MASIIESRRFISTLLPRGGDLPPVAFERRHHVIVVILWAHAIGLPLFGLLNGKGALHSIAESSIVATAALVAGAKGWSRGLRMNAATLGLMTASALLVHFSGGMIEMHFHFFVMVGIVTLYQAWTPFLLGIGYVVLHHGIAGSLSPQDVFNHPAALAHPWKWAAVHGIFILAMSGAGLAAWKFSEDAQRRAIDGERRRTWDAEHHLAESQAMEAALRASEERFRSLVQNSTDCVSVTDREGLMTYISPSVERILGYTPDEFVGKFGFDFVHPDDLVAAAEAFKANGAKTSEPVRLELRALAKDGTWRWLEVAITDLTDDPAVNGLVANFHDVTERRAIESQLRQSQKMDAIGRLAGGIAHDFNNILAVISNSASFLEADLGERDDLREDVVEIKEASLRASRLVRQLLTFARNEVVAPESIDLNDIVAETQKLLSRTIGENVELRSYEGDGLWRVQLDSNQAVQMIMNLVVNSRDAMPFGGRVTIRTGNRTVRGKDHVLLQVSDNGSGIPEDVKQSIFEPFFTTKPAGSGTGLGLSTVFGIVQSGGGWIDVDTEVGKGTTFSIYLPRDAAPSASDPVESSSDEAAPSGGKILLVEDELGVSRVTERILTNAGYEVVVARSGMEGLSRFEKHPDVDLILSDVVMPGMSGGDLLEAIRTSGFDTPVLFMSGYTKDVITDQGVLVEDGRLLQKPFDAKELLSKVRSLLSEMPVPA